MPPTNDFLPFCPTDTGTNLLDESDYTAAADRVSGNKPGIASAKLNNKALRQSSYVVSQLAQFISNTLAADVLDNATPSALLAQIQNAFRPAGEVTMYGGATAPTGWLKCDGSSLLRSDYPALFTAIGTTWGSVDGTHFTLPNSSGLFARGAGSQTIGGVSYSGTLGASTADSLQGHKHSLTDPGHNHTLTDPSHTHNQQIPNGSPGAGSPVANGSTVTSWTNATGAANVVTLAQATGVTIASTTTGVTVQTPTTDGTNGTPRTGGETKPANFSVNFIIKT